MCVTRPLTVHLDLCVLAWVFCVHGRGVTKVETIYTHAKYALKFKVSLIVFLQNSVFLLTEISHLCAKSMVDFSYGAFHLQKITSATRSDWNVTQHCCKLDFLNPFLSFLSF